MRSQFVEISPNSSIHDGVEARDDAIGVYPFTFNADTGNTGDRLQDLTNRTGLTILAGELMGQNDLELRGMPASKALSPPHLMDTYRWQADDVLRALEPYPNIKRIGIGHSLGGIIISGIARVGNEPRFDGQPFDGVELCDNFNLRPEGQPSKFGFAYYQVCDAIAQAVRRRLHPEDAIDLEKYDWSQYKEPSGKSIIANVNDLAGIMRSREGMTGTLALASDTKLPLHVIGLTRGLSGTEAQVKDFMTQLRDTRYGQPPEYNSDAAALRLTVEEGWHSTIINPVVVARNLSHTIKMVTARTDTPESDS